MIIFYLNCFFSGQAHLTVLFLKSIISMDTCPRLGSAGMTIKFYSLITILPTPLPMARISGRYMSSTNDGGTV